MIIYIRHRKFNEVLPYTYFIQHKTTKEKYHGVRAGNIRMGRSPLEDFAVHYFSTGPFKKDFRENPQNYHYRLGWTFDTQEQAAEYEVLVNRRIVRREDWINRSAGRMIINDPETVARIVRDRVISEESQQRLSETRSRYMKERYQDPAEREAVSKRVKGSRWYNDGTNSYFVGTSEAKPEWIVGRIFDTTNSSQAVSRRVRNTKWYNDGAKDYRLHPEDERIPALNPGRLKFTPARFYNNGTKNYRLLEGDPRIPYLTPGRLTRTDK